MKHFIVILKIFLFTVFFYQTAYAQFGKVNVTFDERLMKGNDRQLLFSLRDEIRQFYTSTIWDEEYNDLEIPLQIHIVFEGSAPKGAVQTFLVQALFSNGGDQRYYDKGVQFIYNNGGTLFYDPVLFDPLASFLAFYGNLILAGEIDTYEPQGGTSTYEISRSIALRGNSSDYSRGWSDRIELVDQLSTNYGLRKARFSYYYAIELLEDGEAENAVREFENMIKGLDQAYDLAPREHYTLLFLDVHSETLSRVLAILRQRDILQDLIELDPDNETTYSKGLTSISRH